jgi:hypothetical protein
MNQNPRAKTKRHEMTIRKQSLTVAITVIVTCLFLAACTISLAPRYDPSLVEGLNSANQETLTLFSAVSAGSPKSSFPELSDQYDSAIGKFDALRLQATARATPPLAEKLADQLAKWEVIQEVCSGETGDPNACVNASPSAMSAIVDNLSRMREQHQNNGLATDVVAIFKNAHEISIHQALTVETALKRD